MAEAKQVPAPLGDKANDRGWLLAILGIAAFHLCYLLAGGDDGIWVPAIGVGIALTAWLGYWLLPLLALDAFAIGVILHHDGPFLLAFLEAVFLTGQIGLVWWAFARQAGGSRRLEDPRSATVFLILAPGAIEALAALLQAATWKALGFSTAAFLPLVGNLWISKALGTLALVPPLLAVVTPWLIKHRVVAPEPDPRHPGGSTPPDWTWGEAIETAGLVLGNCVLAVVVEVTQRRSDLPPWPLWGFGVLLSVWASLRQGLRGGTLTAGLGACVALSHATYMGVTAAQLSPLQGNLLAQCSAALLVGASAGWIRASEARYRQVVSHIPVMLYSAHLPRSLKVLATDKAPTSGLPTSGSRPRSNPDLATGSILIDTAEITLVSSACKRIYGCNVEQMLGPYRDWLDRIVEADRELVRAAVHQLCLQKAHVTCEYRLVLPGAGAQHASSSGGSASETDRWVRDTMVPFFTTDGLLAGWEGVVEDITEQQALSRRLRRTSNMLQALITNLPTGVYFVQGPMGQPILVNARARQLLGQREDLAAGIAYLSQVYRLHRADGSIYPTADLPVTKALKMGITSMANDIVIHHADGRRVPLITWGAPVDLGGNGKPDAAVWVLEDLTALHQAELARRESENRLRAVIETMAEGILVQNQSGAVLECNAAAAAILGTTVEALVGQTGLAPAKGCLHEDGTELPRERHPDVTTLRTGDPVRNVILGIPLRTSVSGISAAGVNGKQTPPVRWILVNSMPLTSGSWIGPQHRAARVVTTFADITEHRQAIEVVRLAREKYQNLVESLPLMVLQFDGAGQVTFLNHTTERLTGWPVDTLRQPDFWTGVIFEEDRPQFATALARTLDGYHARAEFRYRSKEGHIKVGLALMQPIVQQGVIHGTTCLVVDMTVQRSLEAELQRAQQLELVGRLAGGTVHDFNNLLTVMIGLAQLAQGTLAPASPAQEYLQNLTDAGEQASHLAGQLLTFAKQRCSTSGVVPLHAVVHNSLRLLKSVLRADIRIDTDLCEGELYVRGEENQLKQVIMNLCLNARDAMPHGGKLLLQSAVVSGVSLDAKNHPAPISDRLVRLTIQDSGAGMDEATLQRMFEPFFSTKERGTGLGLAVVRQILESFGGDIKVWSQPGEGTRMEVYFQPATAPKLAGLEDSSARLQVGS